MSLGVWIIETLEDGWYVVIYAYQFTVFEIWRDLIVLSYIACPRYPFIRVHRLYDNYFLTYAIANLLCAARAGARDNMRMRYSTNFTTFLDGSAHICI